MRNDRSASLCTNEHFNALILPSTPHEAAHRQSLQPPILRETLFDLLVMDFPRLLWTKGSVSPPINPIRHLTCLFCVLDLRLVLRLRDSLFV